MTQPLFVTSEMSRLKGLARSPFMRVLTARSSSFDEEQLSALAQKSAAEAGPLDSGEVNSSMVGPHHLGGLAPSRDQIVAEIGACLASAGVYGGHEARCRDAVGDGLDFMACRGSGFHSDTCYHWTGTLFWVFALRVVDAEVVFPTLGLRLTLAPGDLVVFDPALPHGVTRPSATGRFTSKSFGAGPEDVQMFLSGELPLNNSDWAALGCPWEPIPEVVPADGSAIDLRSAKILKSTGAVSARR